MSLRCPIVHRPWVAVTARFPFPHRIRAVQGRDAEGLSRYADRRHSVSGSSHSALKGVNPHAQPHRSRRLRRGVAGGARRARQARGHDTGTARDTRRGVRRTPRPARVRRRRPALRERARHERGPAPRGGRPRHRPGVVRRLRAHAPGGDRSRPACAARPAGVGGRRRGVGAGAGAAGRAGGEVGRGIRARPRQDRVVRAGGGSGRRRGARGARRRAGRTATAGRDPR